MAAAAAGRPQTPAGAAAKAVTAMMGRETSAKSVAGRDSGGCGGSETDDGDSVSGGTEGELRRMQADQACGARRLVLHCRVERDKSDHGQE